MKEVKEALKRRAAGSLGQASHYLEMAKQLRADAEKMVKEAKQYENDAAGLSLEAKELERVLVLAYGSGSD